MKLNSTLTAAALIALAAIPAASASEWPERPITVVVPFKAGGSSDLTARSFAAAIEKDGLLAQPVSVLNVGGHSSVGARRVMDAAPDGYEFLLHETGILGAEAAGIIDFGYQDFKPVALTGVNCMAILVRKDSGWNDLPDLVDAAKANAGEIVFGVNIGGLNHMSGILLQNASGAEFRFAQIGGSADNFAALTGGQTAVASVSAAGARNFTMTETGMLSPESQVKPIALLAAASDDRLPGVPTAKDQGFDVEFCYGNYWLAPKETPDDIVARFGAALEAAADSERIRTFQNDSLTTPLFLRGDAFASYLDEQFALVAPIAKQATAR